jgi:hypothetical protein
MSGILGSDYHAHMGLLFINGMIDWDYMHIVSESADISCCGVYVVEMNTFLGCCNNTFK